MFWQEDDKKDVVTASDRVVDLSFRIECREIPASHAWELAQALYQALPWIQDEPEVGVHQIHGATSGNGWERPPDDEMIQLSRRTRMNLRVPLTRVDDAGKLEGKVLDVAGCPVTVGKMASKAVEPFSTIFARYVVVPDGHDEEQFLQWVRICHHRPFRYFSLCKHTIHGWEVERDWKNGHIRISERWHIQCC